MSKTLIEIDDEYLKAAQQALGTATKKDTVNAALREVTALAARRRDLQRLTSGGLPDLEDEDVMRAAWQQWHATSPTPARSPACGIRKWQRSWRH
jgi:Arc/MetJ family transcription regulator